MIFNESNSWKKPVLFFLLLAIIMACSEQESVDRQYQSSAETGLTIKNQCNEPLRIFSVTHRIGMKMLAHLNPGGSFPLSLAQGFGGNFRVGESPESTLAELSVSSHGVWYNLSVIPPGCPQTCSSWECCKEETGSVGFNVPMAIIPGNESGSCGSLFCLNDGCEDAYLYPFDDRGNVRRCDGGTELDLVLCP